MTQVGIALLTDGRCNHLNEGVRELRTVADAPSAQLMVREYRIPSSSPHDWRVLRRLPTRLREDGIGVVHAISPGLPTVVGRWLSAATGLPLLAGYSGSAAIPRRRYAEWLLRTCARVVVPSEVVRATIAAAGWLRADRLVIARSGVDPCMFSPAKRSASMREGWRVSDRKPAIVCTGRLSRRELDLLARVRRILDEYRRPHRFVVAASRRDIEAWQQAVPDAAFTHDLDPGGVSEVFASGDLFLSTDQDGPDVGGTLLMAQCAGLPVIAANVHGHNEAMLDGLTGHLCHATSEQDFAWRTAEVLANAPRRMAMATSAAAYAKSRTWSSSLEPLIDAYRDVSRPTLNSSEAGAAIGVRVRASGRSA